MRKRHEKLFDEQTETSRASECARSPAPQLSVGDTMTRVAFFGFYGRRNFGDDLFGYLLQNICRDIPNIKVLLVGASPQQELTKIWRLPGVARLLKRGGLIATATRFLNYCAALVWAEAAVFGGGSLFGAHASTAFARLIVNWGVVFRKHVYAVGVSVGPFTTGKRRHIFTNLVGKLRGVAVRDTASVLAATNLVSGFKPLNLGDLAYALPCVYQPKIKHDKRRTLIVSVHLPEYLEQVLAVIEMADLNEWVNNVLLLSLDSESIAVAEEVKRCYVPKKLSVETFTYGASILEVVDLIASASCVVTSKLHGAITSYVYNVPTLLLCYQQKCSDFLRDNGLPGPQERMPLPDICVQTVDDLLNKNSDAMLFDRGTRHFNEFQRFLSSVADSGKPLRQKN